MTTIFHLIDTTQALAALADGIERKKVRLAVLKQVLETLRGLEGTTLTWRLAKKLEKMHPGLKFELESHLSWFQLTVTGEGMDSLNLNMGYKGSTDSVTVATIIEHNQAYLLDEGRIPRMEEELKTLEERIARYNAALLELKAAHEGLGEGRYTFTDNVSPSIKDINDRWV